MHITRCNFEHWSRIALAGLLALSSVQDTAAQTTAPTPSIVFPSAPAASQAEREIRAAEQSMHEAYVKGDRTRFRALYADDATFTYSSGRTVGVDERVRGLGAFPDLRDSVAGVRIYGGATAIVTMQSEYADSGRPVRLQIIRVWVKQGTAWKVAAFQSTPVAE